MITSILDKLSVNAIFDEEEFHHAPDGRQGYNRSRTRREKTVIF